MKILSVSDVELGFISGPRVLERFKDIDLILSCGDLSYFYLEYIESMLNRPLYYVHGNHPTRSNTGLLASGVSPGEVPTSTARWSTRPVCCWRGSKVV